MRKFTLYKDNRSTSQIVRIIITTQTGAKVGSGCYDCGRPFKKFEKVLKISFRYLQPREFCSGCSEKKLREAIDALGHVWLSGQKPEPVPPPEGLPF